MSSHVLSFKEGFVNKLTPYIFENNSIRMFIKNDDSVWFVALVRLNNLKSGLQKKLFLLFEKLSAICRNRGIEISSITIKYSGR